MHTKELIKISKTLNLLYIEDEEISRNTTLELLSNFFVNITIARDGAEGIAKYKKNHFDIIISDINMPRMNGFDMIKEIRKLNKYIAILVISAHNESSYLTEGIELGIDGYLLKPLNLKSFVISLEKICDRIHLKRESENYQKRLEEEVKRKTQEIDRKLYFDELTGVNSRFAFFENCKKLSNPSVFLADINKFKVINEIYGTRIGSKVLKEFALFLEKFTKNTSYKVYRLSGDEFAIIDEAKHIDVDQYQEDINNFFSSLKNFSVEQDGDSISIEVTLGISTLNTDTYESAKVALEFAKAHKKPYEMYSMDIDKRSKEQDALTWKEKTKVAIEENRIIPVYQAIVGKDEKVIKYETLMRMKDGQTNELISPFFFLDIAIKTGLYNALSSHIIFEALHLLDTSSHTLSLNFTYGDIENKSFLNELEALFKISSGLGSRAVFEITESESIQDYAEVKKFILRFRKYGVQFAIDDFGSGFSNFEYILEIEPDYLKIDGSLIKNIDTDNKARILVGAIVGFSHKLGIKVIAEYVHSKVIFDMLKELDVDEYQGFYFNEPSVKI